MEREIVSTHPDTEGDLKRDSSKVEIVLTVGELFTDELITAQRVTRDLYELDSSDGRSRETFTSAQNSSPVARDGDSKLEMEIER